MNKKVLLVTTVSGFVPQFEMENVAILQNMGYEVHYATNYENPVYGDNSRLDNTGIIKHQVDFVRSPFKVLKNLKAYKQLKNVMLENKFSLVHCHTPMGATLARIAALSTKTEPLVYTAHGFHFYKGAKIINWIFYYTIEWILAHFTDVLITINNEDYQRASEHFHMRNLRGHKGSIKKINGVGIDLNKYKNIYVDRAMKRAELGVREDAFVFVSVGELIERKNHQVIIKALKEMQPDRNVQYLICGRGVLQEELQNQISKYNLSDKVKLLGYRTDVTEILKVCDCFIFPSKQEGLPVALMEAMAAKIPVLCSNIRGNIDLIDNELQIIDINSPSACAKAMDKMIQIRYIGADMSKYSKQEVVKEMREIYGELV